MLLSSTNSTLFSTSSGKSTVPNVNSSACVQLIDTDERKVNSSSKVGDNDKNQKDEVNSSFKTEAVNEGFIVKKLKYEHFLFD